jgi:succinate dehydrogenase / fumarate reductase flavoprotein subunit
MGAAEYVKGLSSAPNINAADVDAVVAEMNAHFERDGKENPYALQRELQDSMQDLVGIIRTQSELEQALTKIQELRERSKHTTVEGNRQYNPGWHLAMDLRSLLTVAEAACRAAMERKESRGAHTRDDFPGPDSEWGKVNLAIRQGPDGSMQVQKEPLPQMPDDLKALFEETK